MGDDCTACRLHKFRKKIVVGKGKKPAKILFIGEAPGVSENIRGKPFIGKAGWLLNQGIYRAAEMARMDLIPSYYVTNIVCCRPTDEKFGENREPLEDEVWACREHLERTYLQVQPKQVVFLGDVAFRYYKRIYSDGIKLYHPAYIARKGGLESTEFRRFARDLSKIFKEVSDGNS